MEKEPMILLVDSANGIYAWDCLGKRYHLYREDGNQFEYTGQFHPDNEFWCENIDFEGYLYVKNDFGILWRIEDHEGDIFAINPNAEWNDETQQYEVNS